MTSDGDSNLMFVYGTLRRGSANEFSEILAQNASFAGEALVRGRLFNLGSYPALVISDAPNEKVRGDLYEISRSKRQAVLDLLDRYEGCAPSDPQPHEYRRAIVDVFTATGSKLKAWTYLLNRPPEGLDPIDAGDYLAWQAVRDGRPSPSNVEPKANDKSPTARKAS